MNVKEYFMPERCMYCLDKLNRFSDIAVGDNYIPENASSNGYSSVIIRTELGMHIWERYRLYFEDKPNNEEQLCASQHLELKKVNYENRIVKGLRKGNITRQMKKRYQRSMHKITVGKQPHCYQIIQKEVKLMRIRKKLGRIIRIRKRIAKK